MEGWGGVRGGVRGRGGSEGWKEQTWYIQALATGCSLPWKLMMLASSLRSRWSVHHLCGEQPQEGGLAEAAAGGWGKGAGHRHTHTRTHARTHARTHTRTHTHMHILARNTCEYCKIRNMSAPLNNHYNAVCRG